MAEQQVWDGNLPSDSFLAGRLRAIQTMQMLFLSAHVHHAEPPSREEFLEGWRRGNDFTEMDLEGDAIEGFRETMRWFDKGLAAGYIFPR